MTDEESTTETTYERACRCPKCGSPGHARIKAPAPKAARLPLGTQLHTVYCENKLCKWYNTCWVVQVNSDGSVPPPSNHTRERKLYAGFEGDDEFANRLMASLQAQAEAEVKPGAEIRNRGQR
jgi:hypothetical protein